jgi:UDP-3-O-[3-hydroxymyristoyl] N-acetylglucosamine deacetylase/3-hydroxyacyl-[acyl-carrier-protein] dehydratase
MVRSVANKPGHFVNTQFAKKLNRQWKLQKKKNVPDFGLKAEPVFDINGIMKTGTSCCVQTFQKT